MKAFGMLCLFLLMGTASFMYYSKGCTTLLYPGNESGTSIVKSRKLKEFVGSYEDDAGYVHLEDYRPIDPSPSSKASIRPGPVQHGTPLMPYIPKPSPPPAQPQPKRGG